MQIHRVGITLFTYVCMYTLHKTYRRIISKICLVEVASGVYRRKDKVLADTISVDWLLTAKLAALKFYAIQ